MTTKNAGKTHQNWFATFKIFIRDCESGWVLHECGFYQRQKKGTRIR